MSKADPVSIRILDREYTVGCEPDERDSQIYDSHHSAHLLSLFACEQFDRDKAENESRADQRLFAKRRSGKAQTVVCDVRHRVCHDRRTAQGENEGDCEIDELLHLHSPRAVDMPEDGVDDVDGYAARIPPAVRATKAY